jgi:hypothetical protein
MPATIQLPDDLLQAAERFAAATHHGVNEIVEEALRDWLARYQAFPTVRLITYGQGGLLPGVNLDDSAALLAIMDAAELG